MLLSELGSISINDGVGARDKRRREDNFRCKEPAILRMGLFSDGLSLDMMMIIVKEDLTVGKAYSLFLYLCHHSICKSEIMKNIDSHERVI
jgi:hypothetical protein